MENSAKGYMDTGPGVACLICRVGRVVTLTTKALLEAERIEQLFNRNRVVPRGIFPAPSILFTGAVFYAPSKEEKL